MQHTAFRTVRDRTPMAARAAAPVERSSRSIRAYDAAGKVLFTAPASKVARPSARQNMDAATVRGRMAHVTGKVFRIEIDAVHGAPSQYTLREDGTLREGFLVDGKIVSLTA